MNIAIFGKTQEDANAFLEWLLEKYIDNSSISIIRKSKDEIYVETELGIKYTALTPYNHSKLRGLRWSEAYVDVDIKDDEVTMVNIKSAYLPNEYDDIEDQLIFYIPKNTKGKGE